MATVYFNGEYLRKDQVQLSLDDRGFLLADGVYEVTPAYSGKFLRLDHHLARLSRGLSALRIDVDIGVDELASVSERLLVENGLVDADIATVYLQITRGVAPRTHAFPGGPVKPTIYGYASSFSRWPSERWNRGGAAVTVPDLRWARANIKSIALLPNVLAQQAAVDAGVDDVIVVRDGVALEGARANLFAVYDGIIMTHPCTTHILAGVTRGFILELARKAGYAIKEEPIIAEELAAANELFLTGSTTEVRPIVSLNGQKVGAGRPGPVTRELHRTFLEVVSASKKVHVESR